VNNTRNLNNRISRLEHILGTLPCHCQNSADLAWPGHQPDPHCRSCGGERLIYPLAHHPRKAEPLIRQALPIIEKAFGTDQRADLGTLTDEELRQLKTALQTIEQATTYKRTPIATATAAKPKQIDFESRCSIH
jgi:hypothetical protein